MLIQPKNSSECIAPAKDKNSFVCQGVDAHNAQREGLVLSSEWKTRINGKEIITLAAPVTHGGPQSFAFIEICNEPVRIEAEFTGPLRSAEVFPRELDISWKQQGNILEIMLDRECNILIEVNQNFREPLALFVSQVEEAVPDPFDENVLWYAPGVHYVDCLELKDKQTVYLAPGAVIKAVTPKEDDILLLEKDWAGKKNYQDFIFAHEKSDIKVCGKGIIDTTGLDWHMRRTMVFSDCSKVTVSGIMMNGAAHWTLPFFGCENVCVDNVKLIGYRENSDGIDIVDCRTVIVKNCFIRTGDDAICIKSMGQNKIFGSSDIKVEHCLVWNDKVRALGITGETRFDIHDVVFQNCQVLHGFADWTREVGALCIVISDCATVRDITFRQISVRQENNYVINCMIMKDQWSTDEEPGNIQNISFEDIQLPENSMMYFQGYDREHLIKGIRFTDIVSYESGKEVKINQYLQKNEFVSMG